MAWIPISGDFSMDNDDIVYKGGVTSFLGQEKVKQGILLFDNKISSGTIEMDIEFEDETIDWCEEAEIIFDYINESNFKCVGITGNAYKYEAKCMVNNGWQWMRTSGNIPRLPQKKLHIQIEIMGSFVRLLIDNVHVFEANYFVPFRKTQIGIWSSSKKTIRFSNYKVNIQLPEVFIISQFGGLYDELYNNVIKPLFIQHNMKPIRADEISNSTFILEDIIRSLQTASIIIADITPNNPNVFYELGFAHAIGKDVILLCEKEKRSSLPFDVSAYRTIFYENTMLGKDKIEGELNKYVREILKKQEGFL